MKYSKGFTLIELLVVIAIIGILSSVVLASLTTARSRGTAAAVQSELANMRAQAELYYSTTGNNGYGADNLGPACTTGLFAATTNSLSGLVAGVQAKGASIGCFATSTVWSVGATANGTTYCVDSTGFSGTSTAAEQTAPDGICDNA